MLMTPPPADSYSPTSVNRQATQSLATPGLQRRPILGSNTLGQNTLGQAAPGQNTLNISTGIAPGMPQLSANPLGTQPQQQQMMARMLMGRGQ